jgi:PAS domain S-box-containing protein
MASGNENRFVNEAKRIMDENIHLLRFTDTMRNIEKLKDRYSEVLDENDKMKELLYYFNEANKTLHNQVEFLEEILNGLQVIISIKDLNRKSLLWYNQNYNRILGYRHKELQELNSRRATSLYHPEDRHLLDDRKKQMKDKNQHTCTFRLRHKDGRWIRLNSDYIVLKRNPDGSLSQAVEILSRAE